MAPPIGALVVKAAQASFFRQRLADEPRIVFFADSDSLHALNAVLAHPPEILALDPAFASTARGASLISAVKGEPALGATEVRVLIEDESNVPLLLHHPLTAPRTALLQASRPLDRAGTRRAIRYPMSKRAVVVNGEPGHLVDLSVSGAQVLATVRLQPGQSIRVVIESASQTRGHGTVAWSVAIPTAAGIRYRAGIEFVNPDTALLEAFCRRHGQAPDTTFTAR